MRTQYLVTKTVNGYIYTVNVANANTKRIEQRDIRIFRPIPTSTAKINERIQTRLNEGEKLLEIISVLPFSETVGMTEEEFYAVARPMTDKRTF